MAEVALLFPCTDEVAIAVHGTTSCRSTLTWLVSEVFWSRLLYTAEHSRSTLGRTPAGSLSPILDREMRTESEAKDEPTSAIR